MKDGDTEIKAMHPDREIGKTGVKVSPIGLGAMPLSVEGRPDEETAIKVIHAAIDAGTNFIDTADVYCIDSNDIGHNERLIKKALDARPDSKIVIVTKGGCTRPQGRWETRGSPSHLRAACEQSLKALGVDSIFLYQLHAPDIRVPYVDSVAALDRLKKEGKIQHIGLSNISPKQLEIGLAVTRIEAIQNRFNPLHRFDLDNGIMELCNKNQITYVAHSPFGGMNNHRELAAGGLLQILATKYKTSPYCVILAWHLAKSERIIPIPGASKVTSAADSPRARFLKLDQEDVTKIDSLH